MRAAASCCFVIFFLVFISGVDPDKKVRGAQNAVLYISVCSA